jgi:fucose permease
MALCSLGVAALAVLPWPGLRYPIACYGFGLGVLIPAINLAVADVNPLRSASALSTLNLCWTLGAIAGPSLLALSRVSGVFLFCVAGAASVALLLGFWVPIPNLGRANYNDDFSSPAPNRFAILAVFGVLFFAYVGTENAISGWITFYAVPVFHSAYKAMTVSSVFWAAFLIGRSVAPLIVRKWSDARTVSAAVFAVILGLICLAISNGSGAVVITGALLTGAGLAPVYPILISSLVTEVGAADPMAVICFAFSGVGAAVVPFVAGWTSHQSGHPLGGLSVSFAVLSVLLFIYLAYVPTSQKQPTRGA